MIASRSALVVAAMTAGLASPAGAQLYIDVGARFEALSLDGDFEFSCDCDPTEDPGCDTDPDYCDDVSLEFDHDGWLLGAHLGAGYPGRYWSLGLRFTAAAGPFGPSEGATDVDDATITLTHVTGELPVEAYFDFDVGQIYVQVAPRLGFLNYADGEFEEDPDTFTAGVVVSAGLRLGPGGWRAGVGGGYVLHPSFSGWTVDSGARILIGPTDIEGTPPDDVMSPEEHAAPEEAPPEEAPPEEAPPEEAPPEEAPPEEAPPGEAPPEEAPPER